MTRQDKIVGRIHTHDLHGIDLLRHAHRADLGGDVRSHLAGKDQTEDSRREFEHQHLARCKADEVLREERVVEVLLDLNARHGTDEQRDDADDAYRVDHQARTLMQVLATKHVPTIGLGEDTLHQENIFTEITYPICQQHIYFFFFAVQR